MLNALKFRGLFTLPRRFCQGLKASGNILHPLPRAEVLTETQPDCNSKAFSDIQTFDRLLKQVHLAIGSTITEKIMAQR